MSTAFTFPRHHCIRRPSKSKARERTAPQAEMIRAKAVRDSVLLEKGRSTATNTHLYNCNYNLI